MTEESSGSGANVEHADRLWVATDTASYYRAFVDAVRKARHCCLILAWDLDTRVDLLRGEAHLTLIDLLVEVASARPELQIRVLCWNGALIYALEREIGQSLKFALSAPDNLRFEHDDTRTQDISKHQKLVVVDDAVAFCGGVDLTRRRWDVSEHRPDDPRRTDALGGAYGPFHDVQAAVDGAAARALGRLARERWQHVAHELIPPCPTRHDPWPDVEPDLFDVEVAICRTRPGQNGGELTEIEDRYVAMIAAARDSIYIETQYLTAPRIEECLAARLRERDCPEILVVTPRATDGMTEQATMNVLRWRALDRLHEADTRGRLRVVYPRVSDGDRVDDVYVHSKVCIVDDDWLHVGSANLTTRSLQLDFECDLSVRAASQAHRRAIREVRARLLANHLGRDVETLAEYRSLFALLDEQAPDAPRSLERLEEDSRTRGYGFEDYADPSRPLRAPAVAADLFEDDPAAFPFVKMGLFLCATVALALLWRFTPLSEVASPERFAEGFAPFRHTAWAPLLAVTGLAVLSSIGIPVTILILASGLAMGTWLGSVCALAGSVLGAMVTFEVARRVGRARTQRLASSQRARAIADKIDARGFLAVAALRIIPIAPFVIVNIVAGSSSIRRRDFLSATVLAMIPGTIVIVYYGSRLAEFIDGASPWALVAIVAIIGAVIAVAWWLERNLDRPRRLSEAGGIDS